MGRGNYSLACFKEVGFFPAFLENRFRYKNGFCILGEKFYMPGSSLLLELICIVVQV